MQPGRAWQRRTGSILAALGLVAVVGCGSGGGPQTGGIDPAAYMARFSGEWALDDDVSEDPAQAVPPGSAQNVPDARRGGGGPPGGAISVPGRRGRGGGRMRRTRPDTVAWRVTFETFRSVPNRFSLTVNDSLVVTTWAGDREVRLPVGGDGVSRRVGEERVDLTAQWDGGRLRIERRVPGGATVVDLIEALPERPRLLVTRQIESAAGRGSEIRLAFDRVGD